MMPAAAYGLYPLWSATAPRGQCCGAVSCLLSRRHNARLQRARFHRLDIQWLVIVRTAGTNVFQVLPAQVVPPRELRVAVEEDEVLAALMPGGVLGVLARAAAHPRQLPVIP